MRRLEAEAEPGSVTFQEIRARADRVRGLPLQAVLLATGAEPDRFDKAKWQTTQDVISVTGMKFMNWSRGVGGGGAIDLAIHLNGGGFKDAVEWLWRRFPGPDLTGHDQPPLAPELKLPPPDPGQLARVKYYLLAERCLAPAVIDHLVQSGRLYADDRANAVFLLLGKQNIPVGAELRGTGQSSWRGMAPGSRKDLGYFSVHAGHVDLHGSRSLNTQHRLGNGYCGRSLPIQRLRKSSRLIAEIRSMMRHQRR